MNIMNPYIQLLRPLNLFMVVSTQVILYFLLINPWVQNPSLDAMQFILLALCTSLIAGGGYIINDIYDYKADLTNKPHKMWVGKHITFKAAWTFYASIVITGFIIASYLAVVTENIPLLLLYPMAVLLLWWYALDLKKSGLPGNIVIAFMTSFVCIILIIAERKELLLPENHNLMAMVAGFSWFSFLVNICREWVKDLQDKTGDQLLGSGSLPIVKGELFTKQLTVITLFCAIISIFTFVVMYPHSFHQTVFALVFVAAPIGKNITQVYKCRDAVDYGKAAAFLKFIMLLGLLYLLLFSPVLSSHGITE